MKKIYFIFSFIIFTISTNAQFASKGSSFVQLGYGFGSAGSFLGSIFKFSATVDPGTAEEQTNEVTFKYQGFGPLHFRYEYMLGGRVGMGLSINGEMGKFTFIDKYYDINYEEVVDEFSLKYSSVNAMLRTNIHFLKRNEKLDLYYGFGVGYGRTKITIEENLAITDPESEQDVKDFNKYLNQAINFIPIAVDEVFGGRIAFSENVGMYFEVGYSKAIAQLGIVMKINGYKSKTRWGSQRW